MTKQYKIKKNKECIETSKLSFNSVKKMLLTNFGNASCLNTTIDNYFAFIDILNERRITVTMYFDSDLHMHNN